MERRGEGYVEKQRERSKEVELRMERGRWMGLSRSEYSLGDDPHKDEGQYVVVADVVEAREILVEPCLVEEPVSF